MASHLPSLLHCIIFFLLTFRYCAADFHSIWPLFNSDGKKADGSSNQDITDQLKKDLNNDETKLYTSRSEVLKSTWYWYADLTPELVTKYQSGVPGGSTREREQTPFTNDKDALDQLKILSLPADKPLSASKRYKFTSDAGDGVNIYVIDSGLTATSTEFKGRTVDWIFAGPFASTDETDADIGEPGQSPAPQGHGTCMSSIAMGNKDGVARKSSLTAVRCDVFSTSLNEKSPAEIFIDALSKVYDDVMQDPSKPRKSVVNMSVGVKRQPQDKDYEAAFAAAMRALLLELDKQDVPVAAAAGNDGVEISPYPTLLLKSVNGEVPVPNLIAVGGAKVDSGDFFNDIRDEEIKVYGPADDEKGGSIHTPGLECASRVKAADGSEYHLGYLGTSHATAAVSGLLAYFIGEGNTGANSRANLFHVAQARIKNGPKIANNDVDGTQ